MAKPCRVSARRFESLVWVTWMICWQGLSGAGARGSHAPFVRPARGSHAPRRAEAPPLRSCDSPELLLAMSGRELYDSFGAPRAEALLLSSFSEEELSLEGGGEELGSSREGPGEPPLEEGGEEQDTSGEGPSEPPLEEGPGGQEPEPPLESSLEEGPGGQEPEASLEEGGEEQDTSGEASLESGTPDSSLEEPEASLEEDLESSREGPGEASLESSLEQGPAGQEPEPPLQDEPRRHRTLPGLQRNMQRFKHTLEGIFLKFSKPSENCVELDLATMQYDTSCGPRKWSWKETPIKSEKKVPISRMTHPSKANRADSLTLPVNQPSVIDEMLKEPVSSDIIDKTYSIESSDGEEKNDPAEDIGQDEEQHNLSETRLELTRTIVPIINTKVDLTREINNATVSERKAECKEMSSFDFQHERLKSVKSPTYRAFVFNLSTSRASKIQFPGLRENQWIEKDDLISDCELSKCSNVKKSEDESSQFDDEELSDSEFSNVSIGAAYPKLIDSFTRYVMAPHTARKIRRSEKCNGWFSKKMQTISNRRMNNSAILKKLFETNREPRFKPFRSERELAARRLVKQYKSGRFVSPNAGPKPTSTKLLTVNLQSPMCNKAVGQNTPKPPAYSETTFQSEETYLKEESSVPRSGSFKTSMQREKLNDTTFIKLPFVSQNEALLSIDEKIHVGCSTLTKKTEEPNATLWNVGVQCDAVGIPHFSNSNTQWRTYPLTYNPLKKIPLKEEENICTFEQIYRKLCLDKKSESPRFIRRRLISSRLKEMEPSETVRAMMSSPMFTKVKRMSDFHGDHPLAPNAKRARKLTSSDILNFLFNGVHLEPLDHTQHHSTMSARSNVEACFINSSPNLQSNMNGRCHLPSQTFLSPGVYLPASTNTNILSTVPSVGQELHSPKRRHSPNASVSRKLYY